MSKKHNKKSDSLVLSLIKGGTITLSIIAALLFIDEFMLPSSLVEENNEDEKSNKKSNQSITDYNTLSKCVLLEKIDHTNQTTKYFAAKKIQDVKVQDNSAILTVSYTNVKDHSKIIEISTKETSMNDEHYSYSEIGPLLDFIFEYNYIQEEYTNDNIDLLLSKIANNLQTQKQKSYTLKKTTE